MSPTETKPDDQATARPADQAPNKAEPSQDPAEGSNDAAPEQPGSPRG